MDIPLKLKEFTDVWHEVSEFIAPEFHPNECYKEDYCPYGSDMPCTALIIGDKYAAFVTFREYASGADEVVRLEQIKPDEVMIKRYETKGLDPAVISDVSYYSTAFALVDSILMDWQDKLRIEGKK